MYYLKKGKDGYWYLNKAGRQLINQFYKPPRQHGKKNMREWKENLEHFGLVKGRERV